MGDVKNFKGANKTIMVKGSNGKIVDNIAGAQLPPKLSAVVGSSNFWVSEDSCPCEDCLELPDDNDNNADIASTAFMVALRISEAEHDDDREEYIGMILDGEREIYDEDGEPLTQEQVNNLTREELIEYGEGELGEEWDNLWAYEGGSSGLDQDEGLIFLTSELAQAHIDAHYSSGGSDTAEIVEIDETYFNYRFPPVS